MRKLKIAVISSRAGDTRIGNILDMGLDNVTAITVGMIYRDVFKRENIKQLTLMDKENNEKYRDVDMSTDPLTWKIGKDGEELKKILEETDILFVVVETGGNGILGGEEIYKIIGKLAKKNEVLTIGIIAEPFSFESYHRKKYTLQVMEDLKANSNIIIILPTKKISNTFVGAGINVGRYNNGLEGTLKELDIAIKNIIEIFSKVTTINFELQQIKKIISSGGSFVLGVGEATGENRIVKATEKALNSYYLESSIAMVNKMIIKITISTDVSQEEIKKMIELIRKSNKDIPVNNIFYKIHLDEKLGEIAKISFLGNKLISEEK